MYKLSERDMTRIISVLLKRRSFILYKRTLALVLAFIMLFNLTSEVYAAAVRKDPIQEAFKEESKKIKEVLTESYTEQEPTAAPCTGKTQECYENSLEKFAQTAQRYEDIISNLVIYVNTNNILNSGILLSLKAYETAKADFERELQEYYARQASYEENYDEYAQWLMRKAQQEKINKQEEEVLALLPENEREELRRNNEATKEYLRQGEAAWGAYEKEWLWLQEQKKKLEAKQAQLLQAEQSIKEAQNDAAKNNEEAEKIYAKTFGANHKELLNNLSELEKFLLSKGINFEAIKERYKEAKARYEQELIAQNAAKTEKFINKIKEVGIEQCKAEIELQDAYNKETGDSWEDWENRRKAFTAEKEMHKKCYGLPVLAISDFAKGDYGLSYEEYEEVKYREYLDKYVSKDQIKLIGKDEKTGKKRYNINLGKNWVKENGLKEAQEIAALFLLNDNLGIEAIASLVSEKEVAQALIVNRGDLIELINEESEDLEYILITDSETGEKRFFDVSKDGNIPYFKQKMAEQRKKEEAQKIADDYLKKVEERTTKVHNAVFNYTKRIKEEAYSQLRYKYFPKMVLLAANHTPGEIAQKIGLDLGKYKKELRINEEYEVYAKQEKYSHIRSRSEVNAALDRLAKPRLEVLDWVFIAFPSTWMNYLIRQQDYDSRRYTIIHSEGKHSLYMLKELLKIYVQYFPEQDLKAWNTVAQATYKSKAKGMQEYMLQLANYVEDVSLRHELKKEPQLAKREIEKDEFIRQIGPISVGLVADLLFFVAAAKGITTLARSIVMARALKALTPESRMLFKAINKIAEVHPEAFVRYQNTLSNIKKFENTEKLTKEQIKSLLQLRQNALVYEGQLFEKAKLLSDKSWQSQYNQLSGTFERLSQSTQDIGAFLEKYVATGQEQKYIEEIASYNKLIDKYNKNARKILQDPQWVKYQNNLAEYEKALRIVMNNKGQAVLDSQGKKMPAETKRIRQFKKQLNNKPKLTQEERNFYLAQDRATQGQINIKNFNNRLEKPDYLKKVSDKKSMGYNRPQEVKVSKSAKEQIQEGKSTLSATMSVLWDNWTGGIYKLLRSPKLALMTLGGIGGEFAPTAVLERGAAQTAKEAGTVRQEVQIAKESVSSVKPVTPFNPVQNSARPVTPFKPVQNSNTKLWDYYNYYKNTHVHKGLENIIAGYGVTSIPMLSKIRALGYTSTQEYTQTQVLQDDDLTQFAKDYYRNLTEEDIAKYINEGKIMFAQGQKPAEEAHPLVKLSYEQSLQEAIQEKVSTNLTNRILKPFNNQYAVAAMCIIPGLSPNLFKGAPRMSRKKREALQGIINTSIQEETEALGANSIEEKSFEANVAARVNDKVQQSNIFTNKQKKVITGSLSGILANTFKQKEAEILTEAGTSEREAKRTASKTGLTLAEARIINIAKKAPLLAVLYSFMITGCGDFVSPAVALAKDTFGISQFVASLIPLAGFSMFIFSVPISQLQSRIGKVNVMRLGAATATIGTALPMFFGMTGHFEAAEISQFYAMIASIALICLGSTMLKTGASSIAAEVSTSDEALTSTLTKGDAIKGIPIAIGFIAPSLLPLLGFDWTALYPTYTAFFAGGLAVLCTVKISETTPDKVSSLKETFGVLKNKDIALLAAAGFAYIGAEIGVLSSTPVMLTDLGISQELAGTVAFVTTMLPIIAARTLAPAILKKFGDDKTLIASTVSALAGLGLVLTGNDIAALSGLVLTGLGYGNIFPILLGKAQKKDIEKINEITGVMLTSIVGGAAISPGMAALSDATGTSTGYIVPIVCVAFIMAITFREVINGRGTGGSTGIDGAVETGINELEGRIGKSDEGKKIIERIKAIFAKIQQNPEQEISQAKKEQTKTPALFNENFAQESLVVINQNIGTLKTVPAQNTPLDVNAQAPPTAVESNIAQGNLTAGSSLNNTLQNNLNENHHFSTPSLSVDNVVLTQTTPSAIEASVKKEEKEKSSNTTLAPPAETSQEIQAATKDEDPNADIKKQFPNLQFYGNGDFLVQPESPNRQRHPLLNRIKNLLRRSTEVTIVASSDGHGHIYTSYNPVTQTYSGGAAALAELVAKERMANPNTIVVNNGDETAGALVVNEKPEIVAEIFNKLGVRFGILGNHDTDTKNNLSRFFSALGNNFVMLGGSVKGYNETLKSYYVEEVYPHHIGDLGFGKKVKIAFIGINMSGPGVTIKDEKGDFEISLEKTGDIIRNAFDDMKEKGIKPDAVVLMAHQSHIDSRDNMVGKIIEFLNSKKGLPYKDQINVVIGGHKHQQISDYPFGKDGPLFVEPSNYYNGAVVVNLEIHSNGKVSPTFTMYDFKDIQLTTKLAKDMYNYTEGKRDAKLEKTIISVDGKLTNIVPQGVNYIDATAPNNMADALFNAAISITVNNNIPVYDTIGMSSRLNYFREDSKNPAFEGPMTFQKLGEIAPYAEYAKIVKITGSQLKELISNNIIIENGVPTAVFAFSKNLRVNILPKYDKNGNIVTRSVTRNESEISLVEVESVSVKVKNNSGNFVNISDDKIYYLTALYHMLDGHFEAEYLRNVPLEFVYSFQNDKNRNTTYKIMKNYYESLGSTIYPVEYGRQTISEYPSSKKGKKSDKNTPKND